MYALKKAKTWRVLENDIRPTEVVILKDIITNRHRNIVQLRAYYLFLGDNPPSLYTYYEFCPGGDLENWKRKTGFIIEKCMWSIFLQLADAIAFLHFGCDRLSSYPDEPFPGMQMIIHGDLKPGNVLIKRPVCNDQAPAIVLGDFGSATLREVTDGDVTTTLIFQGPEQGGPRQFRRMTAKSDVWSVGAIMHDLGHGRAPIGPIPPGYDWDAWIFQPESRQPEPLGRGYSQHLSAIMMKTLVLDPAGRIHSRGLVKKLVEYIEYYRIVL